MQPVLLHGLLAVLDGMKAYKEGMRGNIRTAFLYGGSAILGGAIAIGILLIWGAVAMFCLVLALVLVTVAIELVTAGCKLPPPPIEN